MALDALTCRRILTALPTLALLHLPHGAGLALHRPGLALQLPLDFLLFLPPPFRLGCRGLLVGLTGRRSGTAGGRSTILAHLAGISSGHHLVRSGVRSVKVFAFTHVKDSSFDAEEQRMLWVNSSIPKKPANVARM